MILYFFRHGQTEWNDFGKINGLTDIPLNEEAKRDAEMVREYLKKQNILFDQVVSSPLCRAIETASLISGEATEHIIQMEELVERNFRSLEGMEKKNCTLEQIEEVAESHMAIYKRIMKGLKKISKLQGERILVVSHESILRHINTYICKSSEYKILDITNYGFFIAETDEKQWKVIDETMIHGINRKKEG